MPAYDRESVNSLLYVCRQVTKSHCIWVQCDLSPHLGAVLATLFCDERRAGMFCDERRAGMFCDERRAGMFCDERRAGMF